MRDLLEKEQLTKAKGIRQKSYFKTLRMSYVSYCKTANVRMLRRRDKIKPAPRYGLKNYFSHFCKVLLAEHYEKWKFENYERF